MSRKIIGATVGTNIPKPNLKQDDPTKGDYVKGKDILPTKVSQLENDLGYLIEHQDISGKLDVSALPDAINTALAQAKKSGEFDGADGADGNNIFIGMISGTFSTNYTVTSLKTFLRPKDIEVCVGDLVIASGWIFYVTEVSTKEFTMKALENLNPIKGKDYFTEEEKTEIAEMAAEMVDVPEGGSGVYILADGETIADAPADADVVIDPNGDADLDIGGGNSGIYTLSDGETFADVPDDVDIVVDPNIEADSLSDLVQAVIAALPIYNGEVEAV